MKTLKEEIKKEFEEKYCRIVTTKKHDFYTYETKSLVVKSKPEKVLEFISQSIDKAVEEKTIEIVEDNENRDKFDEMWCAWYTCPKCDENNIMGRTNYCPDCGSKIKWLSKTN